MKFDEVAYLDMILDFYSVFYKTEQIIQNESQGS